MFLLSRVLNLGIIIQYLLELQILLGYTRVMNHYQFSEVICSSATKSTCQGPDRPAAVGRRESYLIRGPLLELSRPRTSGYSIPIRHKRALPNTASHVYSGTYYV